MTVENLLSRLDKVKRTGAGRWLARCPAHNDKSPSLSVRELDDGRVLAHCFTGCEVAAVLAAAGLTFDDLYPERRIENGTPERRPFPAVDVLRAIAFEALVVAMAASRILSGKPFADTDRERLFLAVSRIEGALTAAGISHG